MKLELWQAVCLLWIALCVGSVLVGSALDVLQARQRPARHRATIVDPSLPADFELPEPVGVVGGDLLNAHGPCRCRDCLLAEWRR